ncbi:unnamed protein product [Moneuplotes crassus]|uniref:Uncharacterized protein n=1 Tax=Euplotes crassus TaxID=5936 RepID=A0AAD1XUW6_EUPCR|nr:unnamed protein product [Moneuplotes crassus]
MKANKFRSGSKLKRVVINKKEIGKLPYGLSKARILQNMTPEVKKPLRTKSRFLEPIEMKAPSRKHSNSDEINYLKKEISTLITKLGISEVMKDPEKAIKLDEALSKNKLTGGVRSRLRNNKSFDHVESRNPKKLKPLNINIRDHISKFQNRMHSNKRTSPTENVIKIDENKDMFYADGERWKVEKLEKGTSWKKRFQMMYRAKMQRLDNKIKATPAYQDYRSIMKEDSIMGRRRVLHSIYDTIDESFKDKDSSIDKDLIKTDHFIESLSQMTKNFSSKLFLKMPLEKMLEHFKDPAWLEESDDEDLFPLLMGGKKSKRKSANKSSRKRINSKGRNSVAKSSQGRKLSDAPYLMSESTQHLEVEKKSPRKKSHQLLPEIKPKDELLININIKAKRKGSRF